MGVIAVALPMPARVTRGLKALARVRPGCQTHGIADFFHRQRRVGCRCDAGVLTVHWHWRRKTPLVAAIADGRWVLSRPC